MQENLTVPSKWSPRQVMQATLFVALVVLSFWLIFRLWHVLFIFFIGVLIGTATKPAVNWLSRRGLQRLQAEILVYLVMLVAVLGFFVAALPMVLNQTTTITGQLSGYYNNVRNLMVQSQSDILTRLGFRLPSRFDVDSLVEEPKAPEFVDPAATVDPAQDLVVQAFRYLGIFSRSVFTLIAILLASFYWTLEGDRAIRSLLILVPKVQRDDVRDLINNIEARLGGYLLGQITLCVIIGILQLIAYLIIGMPNALVLALIAGVLEAVPVVGPALGAVPAILVALTTAPEKVIWVIVASVIIQFIENNWLVPRIMDKSVGVNPVLTLLALAAFSSLMGLPGALLAIPLAAVMQLLINRYIFNPHEDQAIEPEGRDYVSYLRYQAQELAQDIRKQVRSNEEEEEQHSEHMKDAIEAIANDLDRLLGQTSAKEGEAT